MIEIDLNPKSKKRKRIFETKNTKKIFIVFPQIVIAAISLSLCVYVNSKTNEINQKKTQLSIEKDKLKITENTINKLKNEIAKQEKEKDILDSRFEAFQYVVNSKKTLLIKLNKSVSQAPNGLWLESIELSKDSIKITGNSLDLRLIARYYQYLSTIYKNIIFNGTERKVSASNIVFYSFLFEIKE